MNLLIFLVAIGFAVNSIRKSSKNNKEENRRKNTVCHFDGDISEEEFYAMVKQGGKGIKRLTSLEANNAMVYGVVRSQSGISDWYFKIDFNDYGRLTGAYWITSDNDDSKIPETVADRIAVQIRDYSGNTND